jgi:DNA-binding NtrC family response regulator
LILNIIVIRFFTVKKTVKPESIILTPEIPEGTASNGTQAVISETGPDIASILRATESKYFEKALLKSKGNKSKAARLLNLNHYTFRNRRKKLNL